ncbi:MAG: ATP-binding protein [Methanosarcinales archaeon]|nr:ATP-binding protein [Methanosarcinales archaeon]
MKRIKFHDRKKEIKEIMNILDTEPSLITFIYGPINSGKTTMISHLIEQLPEDYAPFYINLRGRFITDYEDFLNVLFEIDEKGVVDNVTEYARSMLNDLGTVSGIPIPVNLFEQIFEKKDKSKDMFKYIEQFFTEISKNRVPVLIIDELQVIGDLKIDGLLIYKLFNFFIRLTKELHLCHIFAVSSDSLFIEQVYSEAMLQGRSRHLLVDDFNKVDTMDFLNKHNFSDKEKELTWNCCGGKPICLVELANAKMNGKDIESEAKMLVKIRTSQILSIFDEISLGKVEHSEKDIIEEFKNFEKEEIIQYARVNERKIFLVGRNVLFIDPVQRTIKPQSKLNLLAIREVINSE